MNFMTASVDIKVDDSKLTTQLAKAKSAVIKTVNKIKSSFKKMGASFKAVFSKMARYAKWGALAMVGAFLLVTRAAMKQEDAINRLNITLKATGHAAGLTSKQLIQQAAALQQVTRFGDETIIAMQTMLLTFKNIRGDEFKRATEAALDMATAEAAVSGRAVDLTAVSIRLGKALNDPVLGLTALSRVGVDFTDTQKSLIKELVRTGQTAEAQRVILKELESQFGGMSRDVDTASGALRQMWNALGDVAEMIGAAFIPGIKDSARAVKKWAEDNQAKIGQWAETAVAYFAYVKDVLWAFILFMKSDWKAGIKYGLKVSLELFKGFVSSVLAVLSDMATSAGRMIHKKFLDILGPRAAKALGLASAKTLEQLESRHIAPLSVRLKHIVKETAEAIGEIEAPPEIIEKFDESLEKLKSTLGEIGITAEKIQDPMEKALIQTSEKATQAMDEAREKMRQWGQEANDIWGNLADTAISTLDGMADSLTDLVLTGKADFNSLANSILRDLTRMIIKQMMFNALSATVFPMLGIGAAGAGAGAVAGAGVGTTFANPMAVMGAPGLQHGGTVEKTGWAKVHKGETFSGVDKKGNQGGTVNINVNSIDAAGTYQFLSKNKRAIASMLQGTLTSNHPLRRTKGWKS
jgi:hypothetical protein